MSGLRVDIALPILNEEVTLLRSVELLSATLATIPDYDWALTIVDNGSHDASWRIAKEIARSRPEVRTLRLDERGRGRALKKAWMSSCADIVAYMDIDLSTSLAHVGPLIDAIATGPADVAVGSRLADGAEVTRSLKRELISHAYNFIARKALKYPIRDAQCGFKAVSRTVVEQVVPLIEDDGWFFDTELLFRAWKMGFSIEEIPVAWVEDVDSRVRLVPTARDDLRGISRLRREARTGSLATPSEPGAEDSRLTLGNRPPGETLSSKGSG